MNQSDSNFCLSGMGSWWGGNVTYGIMRLWLKNAQKQVMANSPRNVLTRRFQLLKKSTISALVSEVI